MIRRVVVTGVGPVSSIGIGKEDFWENAKSGKGYFRVVDFPEIDLDQYRSRICSPVDNFNPELYIEDPKKLKRAGKSTRYSVVGSLLALKDAGFTFKKVQKSSPGNPQYWYLDGVDPFRVGVILGQSVANVDMELTEFYKFVRDRGPKKVNIFTLPQSNPNVGASTIAELFCFKGSGLTISTACASSTHAIGIAASHIKYGFEDLMITGGSEAPIDPYVFSGFDIIRALSKRNEDPATASRPFDKERDGFVLGEGAGIIVLEELGHALKRGARIYAELVGYGFSQDAYNIVSPEPTGKSAIQAIKKAMEMAGISAQEVEYINAHGTSTILNDPNESFIIKQVFGEYAYKIPISSSKSYFGHPLGAAGGLETIVTLLIMNNNIIAPTANLFNPDVDYVDSSTPDLDKRCDLDYVPLKYREKIINVALNESFGFGGQNAVVLFKKYDGK